MAVYRALGEAFTPLKFHPSHSHNTMTSLLSPSYCCLSGGIQSTGRGIYTPQVPPIPFTQDNDVTPITILLLPQWRYTEHWERHLHTSSSTHPIHTTTMTSLLLTSYCCLSGDIQSTGRSIYTPQDTPIPFTERQKHRKRRWTRPLCLASLAHLGDVLPV